MHDDVHNRNEYEEDAMGENVQVGNAEMESNGEYCKRLPQILHTP